MDCIFCQIIEGKIPAEKVQDSENVVSIMDINPVAPGHTLVLPRKHFELLTDLPGELMQELAGVSQNVAKSVMKATDAEGFNYLANNHKCAGQAIGHAHIHIIPRRTGDGIRFNWSPKPYPEGELEKIAGKIREGLK